MPPRFVWRQEPSTAWPCPNPIQGSPQDLYNIISILQNDPAYSSIQLAGPATLNADAAAGWYDVIRSLGPIGTTHWIAGSFNSYVNFFNVVQSNGGTSFCPELHNVVEAIVGAEHGMGGGIWWLRCDLTRGDFVKACQGKRLGYAEDRGRLTAAAVYRGTNGAVRAFLGSSERDGLTTSYGHFSKDRDVFFNGDDPRRDFTVNVLRHHERRVNIIWGADVPPAINGRYIVVNRNSGTMRFAITTSGAAGEQTLRTSAPPLFRSSLEIFGMTAPLNYSLRNW